MTITRNVGVATWWLASEDEWYKAAYHQPSAQGGDTDDYWLYPTASNTDPTVATANAVGDNSNPGANVANYLSGADWNSQNGNVTTVGSADVLSDSFYGTADQGGNVWEWNEALVDGSIRGLRGGSLNTTEVGLQSSFRNGVGPTVEDGTVGFRVATVPEPSTAVLAMAGVVVLGVMWAAKRGKGRRSRGRPHVDAVSGGPPGSPTRLGGPLSTALRRSLQPPVPGGPPGVGFTRSLRATRTILQQQGARS